jgi:hypothetical protein
MNRGWGTGAGGGKFNLNPASQTDNPATYRVSREWAESLDQVTVRSPQAVLEYTPFYLLFQLAPGRPEGRVTETLLSMRPTDRSDQDFVLCSLPVTIAQRSGKLNPDR